MTAFIEDYALVSDLRSGALISRQGSVDWLCFPRFDSPSVFAALLGNEQHGRWLISPADSTAALVSRRYKGNTFIVESTWKTRTGELQVTDFMPVGNQFPALIRRISGIAGSVVVRQELSIRPQYASVSPWMSRMRGGDGEHTLLAMAGPDAFALRGKYLPMADEEMYHGEFNVDAGEVVNLELRWFPSYTEIPVVAKVDDDLISTEAYWTTWSDHCRYEGPYSGAVKRSLLVLRALTDSRTGGIIAAPTTSLPEEFGGSRNWDYRFCWLRDAALTLEAMLTHGYETEALKWRDWLLRALAGDPAEMQIMYGVAGERDLEEKELPHLPGYEGSRPVRVGNGAVSQYQADVVGEVMVALERLRQSGGKEGHFSWALQTVLLEHVEDNLDKKDLGLWEMRGEPRYFTHSRAMMWAAFDCGVRAIRDHGLQGPLNRWVNLRDGLKREILEYGFDKELESFTQSYGSKKVDASLLVLPQIGFLSYSDPLMAGTVARIETELRTEGDLLLRYRTDDGIDGLPPGEHPFLACSFWYVEQLARSSRRTEALKLMDRLVGLANDLGLMSEEYAVKDERMAGNFPQAFTHLALVRSADSLEITEPDS